MLSGIDGFCNPEKFMLATWGFLLESLDPLLLRFDLLTDELKEPPTGTFYSERSC